ncbi:MAG: HlyD family type I secretion periplasmic adaptor subunit [Rhodobiaceae bacterium]|nr:HlyD family type I secretion periplasmic adaptor subunit [Rhodobiaceae bacterium]
MTDRSANPSHTALIAKGAISIGAFLSLLIVWSIAAPLATGTVSSGVFAPEGLRRSVTHLEGGMVKQVHVVEGQRVAQGEPLISLEGTHQRAALEIITARLVHFKSVLERLIAEQTGAPEFVPTPALISIAERSGNEKSPQAEQALFLDRRRLFENQLAQVDAASARHLAGIASAAEQARGYRRQLSLLEQEAVAVRDLVEKGYARRPRLLALLRSIEQVEIQLSDVRSEKDSLSALVDQARLERVRLEVERRESIDDALARVQRQLAEALETYASKLRTVEQLVVTAPVAGAVMNLQVHDAGFALAAGQQIVDIVPSDETFLIDTYVPAADIEDIRKGVPARIRLLTESLRSSERYDGEVVHVGSDVSEDRLGRSVFLVRVGMPEETFDQVAAQTTQVSGAPAEVTIQTGSTHLLDYLLSPILDAFRRGLREK